MAFCSNCGARVPENANYCSVCGESFRKNPNIQKEMGNGMVDGYFSRMRDMEEVQKMLLYFSQRKKEYEKCERLRKKIHIYSKKYPPAWFILFCVLLGGFAGRYALAALTCGYMDMLGIGMAIMFGLFIVGLLLEKLHLRCRLKKVKKYSLRINEIEEKLFLYYKGYENCVIGFEFSNPHTLACIYSMLSRGEVNSIADAVKILSWSNSFS